MKLSEIKQLNESQFYTDRYLIKNWLASYNISQIDYVINDDLTVDVNTHVILGYNKQIAELPVKFGTVYGNFKINNCALTSLIGCPHTVHGEFHCDKNYLKSLEGCPKIVLRKFECSNNYIRSLEGISDLIEELNGQFLCFNNPIETGGIGLLLIKGITNCYLDNGYEPTTKASSYIGQAIKNGDDIYKCQTDMLNDTAFNLEKYAQL